MKHQNLLKSKIGNLLSRKEKLETFNVFSVEYDPPPIQKYPNRVVLSPNAYSQIKDLLLTLSFLNYSENDTEETIKELVSRSDEILTDFGVYTNNKGF